MNIHDVIANTYVRAWDHHVLKDGAEAVLAELAQNGLVVVPFNAIADLVRVHTRTVDGLTVVEIGAKPDPFMNGVNDMHHYVEAWRTLRAVIYPQETQNGKDQAVQG